MSKCNTSLKIKILRWNEDNHGDVNTADVLSVGSFDLFWIFGKTHHSGPIDTLNLSAENGGKRTKDVSILQYTYFFGRGGRGRVGYASGLS